MHTASCFTIAGIFRAAVAVVAVDLRSPAMAVMTGVILRAKIAVVTGRVLLYRSELTTRCRIAGVGCTSVMVVADHWCMHTSDCGIAGVNGATVAFMAILGLVYASAETTDIHRTEISVVTTGGVVRYGSELTTPCWIAGVCRARVIVVANHRCVDTFS